MAKILSRKQQCNANNTEARPSYWAQKILLVLDNYLEIGNLNEYKKNKIKLIVDGKKKHIVILVY